METRRHAQDLDALARVYVADNTLPYYRSLLLQSNQKEGAITSLHFICTHKGD